MDKKYKINEFAPLLNVSVKTLQRWDNDGILKASRAPTDRRYYTHSQYIEYNGDSQVGKIRGKTVIYTRVSSRNQKDDLKNQVGFLRQYANAKEIIVDLVQDLISITHVFSCRIYGLRKYKKKLKEDDGLC